MKYIQTTLLFCFIYILQPLQAGGGKDFNIESIKAKIVDRHSGLFYPDLMKRYLKNDTTLNAQEYQHLYYGYASQEGYNPYRTSPYASKIDSLYRQGDINAENYQAIIKYARLSLDNFPFDLGNIQLLVKAYKFSGDEDAEKIWFHKLRNIVMAIDSSGDGCSLATAWVVIHPSNEYDLLNILGLKGKKYTFKKPSYDYIELEENANHIKGVYFQAKLMLNEYDRKFK